MLQWIFNFLKVGFCNKVIKHHLYGLSLVFLLNEREKGEIASL